MTLTKPSVNLLHLEQSVFDLWKEWLEGWFDGNSHQLGRNPAAVFPPVATHFQQSDFTGLNGAAIQMVWVQQGRSGKVWHNVEGQLDRYHRDDCTWLMLVRAKLADEASGNYLCRQVAELAHALMSHPDGTLELARKGIREIRPSTPVLASSGPGAIANPENLMVTRLLTVRATLRYAVGL